MDGWIQKCIQLTEYTEYTEEFTECYPNLSVVYSVISVSRKRSYTTGK